MIVHVSTHFTNPQVHVKEKTLSVACGEGKQRIIWLAHVGLSRYDSKFGLDLGIPRGVQNDDGVLLDPNSVVKETIVNGQHVWVLLNEDKLQEKVPVEVLREVVLD